MRFAGGLILIGLMAFPLACRKSASAGHDPIAQMVMDSQRAAYTQHNFDQFISIWADDAVATLGRSETPDEFDQTAPRARFEAKRRLTFQEKPPPGAKMEFADVSCTRSDGKVIVRYRCTFSSDGFRSVFDDVFWLRETPAGWKVERCRFWPIEREVHGKVTRFTPEKWQQLDAEVEQARTAHVSVLVSKLLQAQCYREAHDAARQWTEKDANDPGAWLTRGDTAMEAGDAADALQSWQHALKLDPQAPVPPFAAK